MTAVFQGLAALSTRPWLPWIAIALPILSGMLVGLIRFENHRGRNAFVMIMTVLTSILCLLLVIRPPESAHVLVTFTGFLDLAVRIDGPGRIFITLMAILWPLTSLYAFSYMEDDASSTRFFVVFTMTYGVAVGVAAAANLLTMYCFFELLSLITVPLVMHDFTPEAVHAARKYLYYMLGGTAFAFIGLIFVIVYGSTEYFQAGGVFLPETLTQNASLLRIVFLFTFCGFGAKAAIFPIHSWLPDASVAPTPVTALLHAVAVVNAGVFAITRVTYEIFGTELLRNTWVQIVVFFIAAVTVLYGSSMAVKESHLKRRLAYSTVANLSYMLLGIVMMTPESLTAGMLHMVTHSVMKICLFFCAGAVLVDGKRSYVGELNGYSRAMPVTFLCFALSGLSLIGIPPFAGFISKFSLALASFSSVSPAFAGIAAGTLLASAILTAVYILTVCVRAYFYPPSERNSFIARQDPDVRKLIPMLLTALGSLVVGLCAEPIISVLASLTAGMF